MPRSPATYVATLAAGALVLSGCSSSSGHHEVTYTVDGSASSADLSWSVDEGGVAKASDVRLPWRKRVEITGTHPRYNVSVEGRGAGTLSCTITVDGTVVARDQEAPQPGQPSVAACDADSFGYR